MRGREGGEGNFSVSLDKGIYNSLLFKITQHKKDEELLIAIKEYFNCGYCYLRKKENIIDFKVTKFSASSPPSPLPAAHTRAKIGGGVREIKAPAAEIIIPFFINNSILGIKSLAGSAYSKIDV